MLPHVEKQHVEVSAVEHVAVAHITSETPAVPDISFLLLVGGQTVSWRGTEEPVNSKQNCCALQQAVTSPAVVEIQASAAQSVVDLLES